MFTVLKFNNIYRFSFCLYSCSYGCVLLLAVFLKRKYIIAPSLLFSFPQLFYISLISAANVVLDETEHYILFLVFNCLLGLFSFSSVQSLSHVQLGDPVDCRTPGFPVHNNSRRLLKLMSIESVMQSNHLIPCHPVLLLPSIFPSIRVFSNESVPRIRRPKYWSFSFNISTSNEHPGLISFRMDWLDLLAVQGTLKGLLQHHTSKASILQRSAFFTVQLSHPYMTTGKTIALTRRNFVGKVMSLLFNMLSRLVITFLPRSKRLLISCQHSPSAVILEPKK